MHRPLLLILDGESIKSPTLIQSLERDGWEAGWATPEQAIQQSHRGVHPDVVVVDGNRLVDNTVMAVEVLRARNPELSVVAVRTTPGAHDPLDRMLVVLDPKGYIDRVTPSERWPAELRVYLPSMAALGRPLTSDDIFGDLLADLNGVEAPPLVAASAPLVHPEPPATPAPVARPDAPVAPAPQDRPESPAAHAPRSAPEPSAPPRPAAPAPATQASPSPSGLISHAPPKPAGTPKPTAVPGSVPRGLSAPTLPTPPPSPLPRPVGRPYAPPSLPALGKPSAPAGLAKPVVRVAPHPAPTRQPLVPAAPKDTEGARPAAEAPRVPEADVPRTEPPAQTNFEWLMGTPAPSSQAAARMTVVPTLEPSIRDSGSLELDVSPIEPSGPPSVPPSIPPPVSPVTSSVARDLTVEDLPAAALKVPATRDAKAVADLFGGILEPLGKAAPEGPGGHPGPAADGPKKKDDFTLSGIFGINDPFESPKVPPPEPPPTAPVAVAPRTATATASTSTPPPPDVSIDPNQGQVLEEFGNYYLLEKIAVGGMAELFKAKQRGVQGFQKIVAIKRILPHLSDNDEFVRMFIDEAKLAAQLTHPNIAQIYDLGKAGGFYYIAMEYVDGRDLRSLLRKVREYRIPFPEPVAAYVAMKVAGALDYAHRKRGLNDKELKLVHRDISPQNIILSSEGAVKLVDFGIAKAATKTTQTLAGALKGKLLYMSPEQAMGQPLDSRSDIYSLGLVLFELLTSERCFQADSELGVLEKVRLGRVQNVQIVNPSVSKQMAQILHKGLQKNLEARYPSARFMERDLKEMMVKLGSEPTEHDVAEYVNALLRGTKEQLELLINTRFSASARTTLTLPAVPAQVVLPARLEDQTTPVKPAKKSSPAPVPMPLPRPESEIVRKHKRPNWIIPVLAFLAVVVAVLIWIAVRQ